MFGINNTQTQVPQQPQAQAQPAYVQIDKHGNVYIIEKQTFTDALKTGAATGLAVGGTMIAATALGQALGVFEKPGVQQAVEKFGDYVTKIIR
jgi:biopolymer transport protein ExbD